MKLINALKQRQLRRNMNKLQNMPEGGSSKESRGISVLLGFAIDVFAGIKYYI
jgi:hypothetical protein